MAKDGDCPVRRSTPQDKPRLWWSKADRINWGWMSHYEIMQQRSEMTGRTWQLMVLIDEDLLPCVLSSLSPQNDPPIIAATCQNTLLGGRKLSSLYPPSNSCDLLSPSPGHQRTCHTAPKCLNMKDPVSQWSTQTRIFIFTRWVLRWVRAPLGLLLCCISSPIHLMTPQQAFSQRNRTVRHAWRKAKGCEPMSAREWLQLYHFHALWNRERGHRQLLFLQERSVKLFGFLF